MSEFKEELIILPIDVKELPPTESEVTVRLRPELKSFLAGFSVGKNEVFLGARCLTLSDAELHAIVRHEKTHFVFQNLPAEVQNDICTRILQESDAKLLENFFRIRVQFGEMIQKYTHISQKKSWFQELGRGYFCDLEIKVGEDMISIAHLVDEILAHLSQDNDHGFRSELGNKLVEPLVSISQAIFESLSDDTKKILKENGLLHISGYKEFNSAKEQILHFNQKKSKPFLSRFSFVKKME